jgi:hypothetical protein
MNLNPKPLEELVAVRVWLKAMYRSAGIFGEQFFRRLPSVSADIEDRQECLIFKMNPKVVVVIPAAIDGANFKRVQRAFYADFGTLFQ